MRSIVWLESAERRLAKIILDIAEENPQAARRLYQLIHDSVLPAAEHPHLFRPGRILGTREIVAHANYVVVYRVTAAAIVIIRVLHTRQRYPRT